MDRGFIAVFDSGVGGISVMRELIKLMPNEDYVYFGDSKNAPYGEKTSDDVRRLTVEKISYLIEKGAKAVVIACNTATSVAATVLRNMYPGIPVIGIEPAIKPAVSLKKDSVILCMATEVTLREDKFKSLVSNFEGDAKIIPLACHGLAELVEQGKTDNPETEEYLKELLSEYIGKIDSVVLGCTHYPFVKNLIKKIMGDSVIVFDGGEGTARETERRLNESGIRKESDEKGEVLFENSLGTEDILKLSKKLLNL